MNSVYYIIETPLGRSRVAGLESPTEAFGNLVETYKEKGWTGIYRLLRNNGDVVLEKNVG